MMDSFQKQEEALQRIQRLQGNTSDRLQQLRELLSGVEQGLTAAEQDILHELLSGIEHGLTAAEQDIRAAEQDIQDNRSDIRGLERTIANMALASSGLDRQQFLEQERNTPGNHHVVALVSGFEDSPSSSEDSPPPPPPPTLPTLTSSPMPSLVASGSGLSNDEANNEDSSAKGKCPICFDLYSDEVQEKYAVTFLVPGGPEDLEDLKACGHLCCEECGKQLTNCWGCRAVVLGRNRIHF